MCKKDKSRFLTESKSQTFYFDARLPTQWATNLNVVGVCCLCPLCSKKRLIPLIAGLSTLLLPTIVVTCSCFENNDAVIYMTVECRSPVMRHVFGLQQISPVMSTRMNRFRIFSPWVHLFPLLNGMTRCNLFNPLPHHLRKHLSAAILCLAFSALPKQFSSGCFPVCRVVGVSWSSEISSESARTRPRILQLSQQKILPTESDPDVSTLSHVKDM